MSKFCVIVPIYNGQKYLKKCINSILNQTFEDFELILVNDGSTDKSLEICNNYKLKDNRVKVITIENSGSIKARNVGVENATADYLVFVDCDDWVSKNMLYIFNKEIGDADILVSRISKVIGRTGIIKRIPKNIYFESNKELINNEVKNEIIVAYLYGHPFPSSLCGKVYKRELLENYNKYITQIKFFGDDLYFNMEIFLHTNKVKIITDTLYYYRYGGNTSKYMSYLFDDSIAGYNIQKEVINTYFEGKAHFNGISIMLLNTFKTCLMNIFMSNLDKEQIKEQIKLYVHTKEIKEASMNVGAVKYFDSEFLNAIKKKDIDYLYDFGKAEYKRTNYKRILKRILNYL